MPLAILGNRMTDGGERDWKTEKGRVEVIQEEIETLRMGEGD